MSDNYDVIVIGAGPAGYPAAIRAGQNKLTVACVDEWKNTDGSYAFGGTCLNAGCIPSKALLESSELYHRAKHEFAQHGIKIGDIKLDLAQMQKRRADDRQDHDERHRLALEGRRRGGHPGSRPALAGQQRAGDGTRRLAKDLAGEARRAGVGLDAHPPEPPCRTMANTSSIPGTPSNSTPCRSGSE